MTWGTFAKLHYPELVELGKMRQKQHVLEVRKEQSEWTKEDLFRAVKHFVEWSGRLPLKQDYTPDNGLPSYTTFCKISEQVMVAKLEDCFKQQIGQELALEEDEADSLEREDASFQMDIGI